MSGLGVSSYVFPDIVILLLFIFPLATKLYSQHKVRTSLHDRTLESMIPVLNPSRSDGDDVSKKAVGLRDVPESSCDLTSILELRKSIQKSVHHGLSH